MPASQTSQVPEASGIEGDDYGLPRWQERERGLDQLRVDDCLIQRRSGPPAPHPGQPRPGPPRLVGSQGAGQRRGGDALGHQETEDNPGGGAHDGGMRPAQHDRDPRLHLLVSDG
jgi:hypothetical protein